MRGIDFGAYLVVYNFIIGLLVMASSEKFGTMAGWVYQPRREAIARYTRVSAFTFGTTVSAIAGTVYIAFHLLRLGL